MLDTENRKKWLKENTGKITINAKKEKVDLIKSVAEDNGLTASKLCLQCAMYVINNNININDIKNV